MLRCIVDRWLGAAGRAGRQWVDQHTLAVLPLREIERMSQRPSVRGRLAPPKVPMPASRRRHASGRR